MRTVFRASFPLVVFGAAFAAAAGEVWCEACDDWVETPHDGFVHVDAATGERLETEFCGPCDAWVPSPHRRHLFQTETDAAAADVPAAGPAAPEEERTPDDWVSRFLRGPWAWVLAVPAGVFVLVAVLSAVLRSRSASRPARRAPFPTERGVPQGVPLVPGRLVCEKEGAGDGGSATGHRAMLFDGGRWRPAFVKRMVGRNLRPDLRFPALEFEAAVLRKLEPTGCVPRLLAPPVATDAAGETWSYFAMGVAPGEPWPERGGLGRDTRRALSALCEALVKIHDRGIGHYDLKPQNVFWEPKKRRITVIDFGSAIDHDGVLVNPLSAQRPGTSPWVPPASDGRFLADLSPASDAWVYGLMFCEALAGGVNDADHTARRWRVDPKRVKPETLDREWFREALAGAAGPVIAEAVVEGLFAQRPSLRTSLSDFLAVLRKEWGA